MRLVATLPLLLASLLLPTVAFAADSPEERAIEARQSLMHLRAYNVGPLVAMLKGDIPYDADRASTLASNLKAMLAMDMSSAWMKGTSNKVYPDDTRALPGIWASDSEFAQRNRNFAEAVKKLAAVAGDGMGALAPAAKNLLQACKACHDDYREED